MVQNDLAFSIFDVLSRTTFRVAAAAQKFLLGRTNAKSMKMGSTHDFMVKN
jgi:hypothetical protein